MRWRPEEAEIRIIHTLSLSIIIISNPMPVYLTYPYFITCDLFRFQSFWKSLTFSLNENIMFNKILSSTLHSPYYHTMVPSPPLHWTSFKLPASPSPRTGRHGNLHLWLCLWNCQDWQLPWPRQEWLGPKLLPAGKSLDFEGKEKIERNCLKQS